MNPLAKLCLGHDYDITLDVIMSTRFANSAALPAMLFAFRVKTMQFFDLGGTGLAVPD